jgi:hypothetical protein
MTKPAVVLCHLGSPAPAYINTCIGQIRTFSDITIHVIADGDIPLLGDMVVTSPSYLDDNRYVRSMEALPFKKHEANPLWRAAALRFAYIAALAEQWQLEEIIHFDNDVMIYEDPIKLLPRLANGNDIAITECNEDLLIAGFMYMRNEHAARVLACELLCKMETVDDNEMRLLRLVADDNPNLFSFLPMLPNMDGANYFGVLFDCASWGQWVGGTHQDPGTPWAGDHHFVGKAILACEVDVEWGMDMVGRRVPFCVDIRGEYPIINLHIHSKELDKYAS